MNKKKKLGQRGNSPGGSRSRHGRSRGNGPDPAPFRVLSSTLEDDINRWHSRTAPSSCRQASRAWWRGDGSTGEQLLEQNVLAALLAALGKAKPGAQTDFGCPDMTRACLKIELKLLKTLQGWGFRVMSGYPDTPTSNTPDARVKKTQREQEGETPPPHPPLPPPNCFYLTV